MFKSNKHYFKKNRDGSITFKSQEYLNGYIKKQVYQEAEKVKKKASEEVYKEVSKQMEIIARDGLKREFGFGKVRQDRFIDYYNQQIELINDGYVTFEDIDNLNKGNIDV